MALLGAVSLTGCHGSPQPEASSEQILAARTLGLAYLQGNQFALAESTFRQVVTMAPKQALGYANLAVVHLRQGRYAEALTELGQAAALDSASDDIALMLAQAERLTGNPDSARRVLAKVLERSPREIRALYAAKQLAPEDSAVFYLHRILAEAPTNLVARLELLDRLLSQGTAQAADSAVILLEDLKQLPALPADAQRAFRSALDLARRGRSNPEDLTQAAAAAGKLHRVMELTPGYQAGLQHLESATGAAMGYPVLTFNPNLAPPALEPAAVAAAIRFSDAGNRSALSAISAAGEGNALAVGDYDGDGAPDLFVAGRLFRNAGPLIETTDSLGVRLPATVTAAAFGDYDNDRRLDLFVSGTDGSFLLHNEGGRFRDGTAALGLGDAPPATAILFVDLDHDGDLDLVLATEQGLRVYRNPLGGPFQEATAAMGFTGSSAVRQIAFLDFDHDARLDLVSGGDRLTLWHNLGQGRFEDATAAAGLSGITAVSALAVGDYDNDGSFDLLIASGGNTELYQGTNGHFALDRNAGLRPGIASTSAVFMDYDNDGFLDIALAGATGVRLFRNDGRGRFADRSASLPADLGHPSRLLAMDYDRDGDLDLLATGSGGESHPRLLFNQGGNANQYVEVQLTALGAGSGKNNEFGIGATLELRAGTAYQSRLVTGPTTHFGLGRQLKADVLRIRWPNGVPQTLYYPGALDDVLELQVLKGSCPTLFAWDGASFRFVTDVMWRSALGMPLGIMGSAASIASASPHASREYLRLPGELAPKDGRYELRLTEELWEAGYLDRLQLLAVDHPDSTEIFVDERFFPPTAAEAELRLFPVAGPILPVQAASESEGRRTDVRDLLLRRDDRFVQPGEPDRYQGLRSPHDLMLDFGALDPTGQPLSLSQRLDLSNRCEHQPRADAGRRARAGTNLARGEERPGRLGHDQSGPRISEWQEQNGGCRSRGPGPGERPAPAPHQHAGVLGSGLSRPPRPGGTPRHPPRSGQRGAPLSRILADLSQRRTVRSRLVRLSGGLDGTGVGADPRAFHPIRGRAVPAARFR